MVLFDSHRDVISVSPKSLVSNWTVDLNTWNTNRDSEDSGMREDTEERARMDQITHCPYRREKADLDIMARDTIKL